MWFIGALGRRALDDRDHLSNKRLSLAGPLLAMQFRLLVDKMTKTLQIRMQKDYARGREPKLGEMGLADTITRGLRYALATGNWGGRVRLSVMFERPYSISPCTRT